MYALHRAHYIVGSSSALAYIQAIIDFYLHNVCP